MSKIFFIGDTHFYHQKIIEYCDRPQNHDELMIENWNRVVSPEDVVFHLGDVSVGLSRVENGEEKLRGVFSKLNGHKHLIKGNHDHKPDKWFMNHLGFESVSSYMVMGDIFLCHYPLEANRYSKTKEKNIIADLKAKRDGMGDAIKYVVHGHVHRNSTNLPDHKNVSVEVINYTPIEINELLD